jgi:hypothetical protein
VYPRHSENGKPWGGGSRKRTRDRWAKLTGDERKTAVLAAGHYAADVQRRAAYVKHADGWLSERRWEDWIEPARALQPVPPADEDRRADGTKRGVM